VPEDPAVVALVEVAAGAEEALPAGRQEGAENAVALLDAAHCVARLEDRPHVLVPEREAGLDLDPPVIEVEVGAADAGRLDPHDRLVRRAHVGVGLLLYPHLFRRLECHSAHRRRPYIHSIRRAYAGPALKEGARHG
jgi:hypothetical protein